MYNLSVTKNTESNYKFDSPMETAHLQNLKEVEAKLRTYQVTPEEFTRLAMELGSKGVTAIVRSAGKLF